MAHKIAVLDDYQGVASDFADWSLLPERSEVTAFRDHVDDTDTLLARLAPFDVIIAMRERTPFTAERLAGLPNLRLLVTSGAVNAAIDVPAARERGITVCGTGMFGPATAELTWGLILALARHIPAEDRALREGRWQTTVGTDLAGATLGVIGLGRLGTAVARVGQAFGMTVLAWSQNLTPERAREAGATHATKDELLANSDVVTVHLKLSARTTGLIGAADLARMKPTALLVNTSRGPIIDTAALVEALHAHRLGGAALDVYDNEPLPADHPLRTAPNTVLTPHLGYVTERTYEVCYAEAVEDILAFDAGHPVRVIEA
jgi:phosphoglycerate dehydrogenase-like enzyme